MALSDEDKKEMTSLFAAGVAEGLALFRSKAEEEAAKNQPPKEEVKKGGNGDDDGFSFAGFLLGR